MWGWGRIKQGGKRIPFLLLPRALGSCLMWQVQYEPREVSVVEGFEAVYPALPGRCRELPPALALQQALGAAFHCCDELMRQFCSCTSFCNTLFKPLTNLLAKDERFALWQSSNCGIEHVKPGSSGGSLQKQLLYSRSRCCLNKEGTVSFHITLYHLHIWLLSDLLQFLWKVKNILSRERSSGRLI